MLIEWNPKAPNADTARILALLSQDAVLPGLVQNGGGVDFVELHPGIYLIGHFNGGHMFPKDQFDEYPDGLTHGSYGVCDGVKNLLDKMPELAESEREFVVTLTRVRRDEQPDEGGWRWHKWGEYIGAHDPQCEYLYDEDDIEEVFCYHVFERVTVLPFDQLEHGAYYGTAGLGNFYDGARWNANTGKFMAWTYDYASKEMTLKTYDYSSEWNRRGNDEQFAPVYLWTEPLRRTVSFDDDTPLLEAK